MKTTGKNIRTEITLDQIEEKYFAAATIPYSRTKEEVWGEIEVWITARDVKTHGRASQLSPGRASLHPVGRASLQHAVGHVFLYTAASIIILLGIGGFLRFYTKTITTSSGSHLTATLPDQSTVTLNAQSTLKFHPYWWFVSRKIDFSGEGFFKVTKGRKFEVNSSAGKTIVLGTSFNIFARDQIYEVTCVTGKVKVVSPTLEEAVLTADYHARIGQNGSITVSKLNNPEDAAGWTENMFNFNSVPLSRVIAEIGRQYNVSIGLNIQSDLIYTGYFSKDKPVEDVLNLICKPFGLTFVKKSDRQYLINQK